MKYHIISYHIISYHMIISYHIISYHIMTHSFSFWLSDLIPILVKPPLIWIKKTLLSSFPVTSQWCAWKKWLHLETWRQKISILCVSGLWWPFHAYVHIYTYIHYTILYNIIHIYSHDIPPMTSTMMLVKSLQKRPLRLGDTWTWCTSKLGSCPWGPKGRPE